MYRLGLETLAWERLPGLIHARAWHACCVVRGGTLVAVGGRGAEGTSIASVEVLERGSGAWRELLPLSCGVREDLCAVAMDEESVGVLSRQVCILGGIIEEGEVSDGVYIVDLATGECTPQPGLGIPRADMASARLPDGRIIVAGGWSDDGEDQESAEVWEPSRGAWRELEEMAKRRFGGSGCLLSDGRRFAVFGGWGGQGDGDGSTLLESCEALVLDIGAERWEPLAPMLEARHAFACAAVGGCVIVAGGSSDDLDPSSAEVYEEATGVWRRLPCNLPRATGYMGSALL